MFWKRAPPRRMGPGWCMSSMERGPAPVAQLLGAWTAWWPKVKGGKPGCGGKPRKVRGGMEARLKPRGVPAELLWLLVGKWPLLLASEREGAMWEGSST